MLLRRQTDGSAITEAGHRRFFRISHGYWVAWAVWRASLYTTLVQNGRCYPVHTPNTRGRNPEAATTKLADASISPTIEGAELVKHYDEKMVKQKLSASADMQ